MAAVRTALQMWLVTSICLSRIWNSLRHSCVAPVLIESTRGVHGGYSLTRPPAEITVLDVVTCVEGEVAPVECLAHDYVSGSCIKEGDCAPRSLWHRLKVSIDSVLSTTSLADLVADHGLVDALAPMALQTGGSVNGSIK